MICVVVPLALNSPKGTQPRRLRMEVTRRLRPGWVFGRDLLLLSSCLAAAVGSASRRRSSACPSQIQMNCSVNCPSGIIASAERSTVRIMDAKSWANRRTQAIVASFLIYLLLPVPLLALPQDITVRLVDAKSEKPLRKVYVSMFSWKGPWVFNPKDSTPPPKQDFATGITDKEGRVVFHLPEPPPDYVRFLLGPAGDFWDCWEQQDYSTDEILRRGIVAGYKAKCRKLSSQASPQAGEVVIFEIKLTAWEKFVRELP
jgi:hypothetical protein